MARRLQAFSNHDDLSIINNISYDSKPSSVTFCTAAGAITGFQMGYGTGDKEVYGPAHGLVDADCDESALPSRVTEVAFFGTNSAPDGIELTLADGSKIKAGTTSVTGQTKRSNTYPTTVNGEAQEFFGFKSTQRNSDNVFVGTIQVVSYKVSTFESLSQTI